MTVFVAVFASHETHERHVIYAGTSAVEAAEVGKEAALAADADFIFIQTWMDGVFVEHQSYTIRPENLRKRLTK